MYKKYMLFLFIAGLLWFASIILAVADTPSERTEGKRAGADVKKMEDSTTVTLAEGLKTVTAESHVVKVAQQDEAIAEADSFIARARLLPSVNASASHTSIANQPASVYLGQTIPTSDRNYNSYGINIQQILFDFRGNLSRYEASRMLLEAQKLKTASIRNTITLEFTIGFYEFLESQRLVDVAGKEVESVEAHLKNAQNLYSAGVITKNDLLQAQVGCPMPARGSFQPRIYSLYVPHG